jgi:RNA polymerase sigma factor (TIGR02999 family)
MNSQDITRILSEAERGDVRAAEELLPLVYEELRKLAAQKLAAERPGHTLQATALVHEAYLRLLGSEPSRQPQWQGRRHFFGAVAESMRRILVENARRRGAQKRGGALGRVELEADQVAAPERSEELLALDEALGRLSATDPAAVELVKLRYFAGLTIPEAAATLGISDRSADRLWAYARAWLHREISGGDAG